MDVDATLTPSMLVAAALAVLAAFLFALASVLQQRAATAVPDEDALKASLITRLLKQPVWLAGFGLDAAGYFTQAVALVYGTLIIVQPLLVTMLLFALPLGARFAGRRLDREDWMWAVVLTIGLASFLIVGDPTAGLDRGDGRRWFVVLLLIYPLIVSLVASAVSRRGAVRALLLGSAAGLCYGVTDALTKSVVRGIDDGFSAVLDNWETWVLVVTIVSGAFLQQSAYQAGGLRASLPAITGLEPVTGIILGVVVYQEQFRVHSAIGWGLLFGSAIAAVVGALKLARRAGEQEESTRTTRPSKRETDHAP
jgi:drug/metabolite transporter (DMT)-like permease